MKKMTIVFLLSVVVVVLCDWILLCVEEWGHRRKTGLQGIYLGHWISLLVRVLISSIVNKYLSPGYNITGLSFIFFSFYHLSEADISVFRSETQIIAWNNTEQLESRPLSKGEPGLSNGLQSGLAEIILETIPVRSMIYCHGLVRPRLGMQVMVALV